MAIIISPAVSPEMLNEVANAGSHWVYAGLRNFCRKRAEGVDFSTVREMMPESEKCSCPIILAMNRAPNPGEAGEFIRTARKALEIGVKGFILNDMGLIRLFRRVFPQAFIMASIGLSPINHCETAFLKLAGADSVLLSEFLEPGEIKEIKEKTGIKLEIFATGMKEFGYTGKCILSSYHRQIWVDGKITGSAKRSGQCSRVCRSGFFNGEEIIRLPVDFFQIEDLNEYLGLIDIYKIWQGSLKTEGLLHIIKTYRRLIENNE